jgi:hypothetical protein
MVASFLGGLGGLKGWKKRGRKGACEPLKVKVGMGCAGLAGREMTPAVKMWHNYLNFLHYLENTP